MWEFTTWAAVTVSPGGIHVGVLDHVVEDLVVVLRDDGVVDGAPDSYHPRVPGM